jgi:hypothetical protein
MQTNGHGTTGQSFDNFDQHSSGVPDEILPPPPPAEILAPEPPPGKPAAGGGSPPDEGWPLWDVEQIFALPFFFLSRRFGEIWELEQKEQTALARAWKPILDRWLPLKETAVGTALLVTAALVGPRVVMTDWKKRPPEKSTRPENTATAASSGASVSSANADPGKPQKWVDFREEFPA